MNELKQKEQFHLQQMAQQAGHQLHAKDDAYKQFMQEMQNLL